MLPPPPRRRAHRRHVRALYRGRAGQRISAAPTLLSGSGDVRPALQVVEREFGLLEIHSRTQAEGACGRSRRARHLKLTEGGPGPSKVALSIRDERQPVSGSADQQVAQRATCSFPAKACTCSKCRRPPTSRWPPAKPRRRPTSASWKCARWAGSGGCSFPAPRATCRRRLPQPSLALSSWRADGRMLTAADVEAAGGKLILAAGDRPHAAGRDRARELGIVVEAAGLSSGVLTPSASPTSTSAPSSGPRLPRRPCARVRRTPGDSGCAARRHGFGRWCCRRRVPCIAAMRWGRVHNLPERSTGGPRRAWSAPVVGAMTALRLAESDLFSEVALVDVVPGLAAAGLCAGHGMAPVCTASPRACRAATTSRHWPAPEYIVITAGKPRQPGMSRIGSDRGQRRNHEVSVPRHPHARAERDARNRRQPSRGDDAPGRAADRLPGRARARHGRCAGLARFLCARGFDRQGATAGGPMQSRWAVTVPRW